MAKYIIYKKSRIQIPHKPVGKVRFLISYTSVYTSLNSNPSKDNEL